MTRMMSARAAWQLLRAGNLPARLRATREGQSAVRLQLVAAALETGVLDALGVRSGTTEDLAERTGATDTPLLAAFLRVLAAAGLVRADRATWRLTSKGRVVLDDDVVRASYEAFGGFHTALYRDLHRQLTGGPSRRDVAERGEVIARVSAAFEPFVRAVLTRTVVERRPRRVLDVGCGAGLELATMLEAAPEAEGVGVDIDEPSVELARRTLERRGLAGRATVLHGDVRRLPGQVGEVDLALLANVVYYVPLGDRVAFLRDLRRMLAPGGVLLVVTTAATPSLFSRHFDLLLRAQEGALELPDAEQLVTQLTEAGLRPEQSQRIAPGAPIVAVAATRT
ncbi:class I SAM-dependent methyltransferase [Modestobacter marinus]|uniref:class I SAM-dependent methyltransferase n=1 Tax=Modestobacter marinus TaxID=477641 RepID=UPI001C984590|nr:class I SAM-dependent methyltransferase [Modestobacter marinus]